MTKFLLTQSDQGRFLDGFTEPLKAAWIKIAEVTGELIPKVLGFLLILIIGWLLAKLFTFMIKKLLKLVRIHVLAEKSGIDKFLKKGDVKQDVVTIISKVAYWFFMIIVFIVAFNSAGLTAVSDVLNKLMLYFPNIFVALVIVIIGFYLARFVSDIVKVFAGNIGVGKPDILGKTAYTIVIIFIIPLALSQLEIAPKLITNTFLILLGAFSLATAIALGLGSKDLVKNLWEKSKFVEKVDKKEK